MFKKLFLIIMLIMFLVSGMFGATRKQSFRYNYPNNALYETVSVNYDAPETSSTSKIITGINIASCTLTGYTTGFNMTISAQTDYPRNFSINLSSMVAGTSASVTGNLVITGTNTTGSYTTETLTLVSSKTIVGSVAWGYVSTCVLTVSTFPVSFPGYTEVNIKVGVGVKMGLPTSIDMSDDLQTCLENGAATATGGKCDATYNTIDFATDPNGTIDYEIVYIAPLRKRNLTGN